MLRFIARRFLESIPVLWVIVTASFFMLRLVPGGPFTAEKAVTPEIMRNLEAHYGLNKPLWQQYTDYVWKAVPKKISVPAIWRSATGQSKNPDFLMDWFGCDFGPSFKYASRTVNEIIGDKLPVSLELGAEALGVALILGLTLGVIAAVKRNTWLDYVCSSVAMTGICLPTFVLGPILVLVLAIHFQWFKASGWYDPQDRVLPALVLGCYYAAYIARITRGGMLEVLNQDYIRTARAKGASETRIVFRHALRGGLLPVVSFLGPAISNIITGSFVIETIFQIPGLGREFVNSAFNRDYTLVMGTVILYAVIIIVLNLLVDIAQAWMNPKLKLE